MRILPAIMVMIACAGPALAQDTDILLVRKMENCSALMAVISDNAAAKGNTDMSGLAKESSGQFRTAAEYYSRGFSPKGVENNIADAKAKIEYLYKNGGDAALGDDINTCGSEELAKKGQEALMAQKKADEAAAKKGE